MIERCKIHIGQSSSTGRLLRASFWLASVLCFSNYLSQSSTGILPYLLLIWRAIHKAFDGVWTPAYFSVDFMCFVIKGECWGPSIDLWKGMDMVIGSTLHSLPHLKNVQLHSQFRNTHLLRLGVILLQHTEMCLLVTLPHTSSDQDHCPSFLLPFSSWDW